MANADTIKKEIIALGTVRDNEIYCTEIRNSELKFFGFSSVTYHELSAVLADHNVAAKIAVYDADAATKEGLVITVSLNASGSTTPFPKVLHAKDLQQTPFEYVHVKKPIFSGSTTMHSYAIPKQGLLTQTLDAILNHPSTIRVFVTATCLQIIELLDRRIRDGLAESIEKLRQNNVGQRWRQQTLLTRASNRWSARSSTVSTKHAQTSKSTCGKSFLRNCRLSTKPKSTRKNFSASSA